MAFIFNSIILGSYQPRVLFLADSIISIAPLFVFQCLPEPRMPENTQPEKKIEMRESFRQLVTMMRRDSRIHKMCGLYINAAIGSAVSQGLMLTFYCLLLKESPLKEQLRYSSMIMVVYGVGSMCGGQILGQVNDKFGGARSVTLYQIVMQACVSSLLIVINEMEHFGIICFVSGFINGALDCQNMT